ncbi:MAG: threonyl-tRNA synthetase editing domain-containing protein [Candidatus Nanohaloarchaea archaeon]|nr:threonyl-tRNA synthetase editing domain-containing protein [Candidatus Nanohaloarchaea archaeon]
MKLLLNHVSSFRYEVTERTDIGRDLEEGEETGETGEALLVKVCTEQGDSRGTVETAAEEVSDAARQIGVDRVVLFPWAHLSSDLASPSTARELLEGLEEAMEEEGYEIVRVPFGWYKEFQLDSKGHPMSVRSKSL